MRIQLKAIRTNVSKNTTMVTNMRSNKGFRISQISFGFHTFITFLKLGHKAIEEEGSEEIVYPKPVLSELGFEYSKAHQVLH